MAIYHKDKCAIFLGYVCDRRYFGTCRKSALRRYRFYPLSSNLGKRLACLPKTSYNGIIDNAAQNFAAYRRAILEGSKPQIKRRLLSNKDHNKETCRVTRLTRRIEGGARKIIHKKDRGTVEVEAISFRIGLLNRQTQKEWIIYKFSQRY